MTLPPRSSRLPEPMLMAFDVACGDGLVPDHAVIVRGLSDQGRSNDDLSSRDHTLNDVCQMVDLVYEIVPGVASEEAPEDPSRPFTVDATYDTDVILHWSTGGTGAGGLGGPGWIDNYSGGESTVGGLGPWPVPDGAQHLIFWLHAADTYSCVGALRVDLHTRTAQWEPQASTATPSS